jgi:hypothetical protein
MADHKHGDMDTKVQQSTYDAFIKFGIWSVVAVICIFIFMAIFAT